MRHFSNVLPYILGDKMKSFFSRLSKLHWYIFLSCHKGKQGDLQETSLLNLTVLLSPSIQQLTADGYAGVGLVVGDVVDGVEDAAADVGRRRRLRPDGDRRVLRTGDLESFHPFISCHAFIYFMNLMTPDVLAMYCTG